MFSNISNWIIFWGAGHLPKNVKIKKELENLLNLQNLKLNDQLIEDKKYQLVLEENKKFKEKIEQLENYKNRVSEFGLIALENLSFLDKIRIAAISYLREENKNIKIPHRQFYLLKPNVKQNLRDWLMIQLKGNPNASDICDNFFKKPRKVNRNQDIYRTGNNYEDD